MKNLVLHTKLNLYQHTINSALTSMSPERQQEVIESGTAQFAIGNPIIWYCKDGYIIGFENAFEQKDPAEIDWTHATMAETFNAHRDTFFRFFDPISKMSALKHKVTLADGWTLGNNLMTMTVVDHEKSKLLPPYSKFLLFGKQFLTTWNPVKHALDDVNLGVSSQRLGSLTLAEKQLQEFRQLIDSAQKEEEVQQFLQNSPHFLFPEYESVIPKPQLGGKRIPDFAMSVRNQNRLQWYFVEIERPSKDIFTKSEKDFQFTAPFTQAKGQLLQWDAEITDNITYYQKEYPDLLKPIFLLVYGRNAELDKPRIHQLSAEFASSSNRLFMTYDDVADRMEKILARLSNSRPQN